jgi:hypothetical protein
MYLFSRRARLAPGNTREAMMWATSITEKVNQIVGLNTSLFAQTYSPEVGTLVWSTFVPDLATLESANDKLLVDDGYVSMVDAGAKFSQGGIDDTLLQLITGDSDPSRQVDYATTIRTVCATGSVARGIELGVEIAQRAEKTIGIPVMFATSATGPYGTVAWITGYADVQALEAANQALAADTMFGEFVDKNVRGVYAEDPAATESLMYRRIV